MPVASLALVASLGLHFFRNETNAWLDAKTRIDPSLYSAGTYTTNGVSFSVHPALEPTGWRFFSWGGWRPLTREFTETVGFNAVNVSAEWPDSVEKACNWGLFANIRYEHLRAHVNKGEKIPDDATLEKEARDALRPYAGLANWTATLVNSEVYTDIRSRGGVAKRGVVANDDPDYLKTVEHFMTGMEAYRVNAADRRAVHALKSGNLVWSEPVFSPGAVCANLDGVADWLYEYDSVSTLTDLRKMYGRARGWNVAFQPTLAFCYYPAQLCADPRHLDKDGKPKQMAVTQSADELKIKSWMAIGAVRADSLAVYEADAWQTGVEGARARLTDPDAYTWSVADTNAPSEYGDFVRRRLKPAAILLQGLEPDRAPVALYLPSTPEFCGSYFWGHHWGSRLYASVLASQPLPFDTLGDREASDPAVLAKYKVVFVPLANVLLKREDAALAAAEKKGVRLVFDAHGAEIAKHHPKSVKLGSRYVHIDNPAPTRDPFLKWYVREVPALAKGLVAFTPSDGRGSWTFTKSCDGVVYVVVVNDARRMGGGMLTDFKKDAWYRPYGAPQTITTHFRVPAGAAIYEFNSRKPPCKLVGGKVTLDYAPAEGRLFAIYPRPLGRFAAKIVGRTAPGEKAVVRAALDDVSHRPAPGRQIVRLVVARAKGEFHDESGYYRMENGRLDIPLRFARDDPPGPWTVAVEELTTGQRLMHKKRQFR